jgi:hypothetical protein
MIIQEKPSAGGRAVPESIRLNREARRLVEPLNERVGTWQVESIRLQAAVERTRRSGCPDPEPAALARTLLTEVEDNSRQFEEQVAAAARELATHSRISDTRMSLRMIAERLRRCLG